MLFVRVKVTDAVFSLGSNSSWTAERCVWTGKYKRVKDKKMDECVIMFQTTRVMIGSRLGASARIYNKGRTTV